MAANQYSYPPPPPPPSQSGPPAGYAQYQQHQYGGNPPNRGGGRGRGRGGNHNQGGRGDFHASSQYNHHAGGYNAPAPVGGGYVQQNPAPYIGPQPPASLPSNGYPGPQWHEPQQHHGLPHHHQPQQVHQPPAPIPLSAQNYHPNYAPQVYNQPQPQQPPQYGPQQPFQHSPPQNSYPQHLPPSQPPHPSGPPQQQWQGPPHQVQPPFNNGGRGRGRGNGLSRGGYEAPLMGPPIRMGFGDDRSADPMPQASNGYPPPYVNPQHSPAVPFSQPSYQGYPQQNFSQRGRPPLDPNPFYSQNSHRGRGGFQHRGKRELNTVDKMRHRSFNKNRHSNGSSFQGSVTDLPQKPVVEDGDKVGDSKKKKKKKRKTNTLGLTPRNEEYEESEEEDDADEESRLAATVVHTENSNEPSNLTAWLAERRQRWPTKARREAKEAELAKRYAQSAEQSARSKLKAKKERDERDALEVTRLKKESESKLERQQKKAEKLRKQLERAEKKLQDAMNAGTKRKRDARDEGDEDGEINQSSGDVGGDLVDQVIAQATAGASAMDLDSDSDSSGSSEYTSGSNSDDDSHPEPYTSRSTGPVRVLPPKKPILQRQCKYFSTGGTCGKKGKCRFVHDQGVRDAALLEKEMNGGRMTLAQRLVQNDKEKDDLLVLKSVKYLYENGVLAEPQATSAPYENSMQEDFKQESFKQEMDFENGSPVQSFDNTSQPEVHDNMLYGED